MLKKLLKNLGKPSLLAVDAHKSESTLDELLKAKARLRAIYDTSFDALISLGDEGFIDCNNAALTLFGCTNNVEFCRYHPSDLSPSHQACGADSKVLAQHYIELALKNGHCRFEWLYQRVDNGVIFGTEVQMSNLDVDGVTVIQCVLKALSACKPLDTPLIQAQTLQDAIVHSASSSTIAIDIHGIIQVFNIGSEKMLGFLAKDVINIMTSTDLADEEELKDRAYNLSLEFNQRIGAGFEALVYKAKQGIEDTYETHYRCKDGRRLAVLVSVSALYDAEQTLIGYVLMAINNTARKLAEKNAAIVAGERLVEKLKEATSLQDAIFNCRNFSCIATDAHGVIQLFNVGAEAMLGYTAAEVINIMTPADLSDKKELFLRADALSLEFDITIHSGFEALVYKAALGLEDIYELTYVCKKGARLPALVSVTALRDDNDAIIGYLLIGTDHTEQKAAKHQLKTLSLAIEQSSSAVMIIDYKANIEYINQAFINSSGYSRKHVIDQNLSRFASSRTPKATYESMWTALRDGQAWQGELINQNKQGEDFIEQTRITPIRQDDGTISHFLSVKDDVTEQKKNEALLVAAKDRAEHLAKTKSQFLANMSHEIRTPMAAIIGFSDLALLNEMPKETYDYLQNINTASNHLLTILNDILDISKLEAGQMTLQLGRFSSADLRTTLHGLLVNVAQAKGLTLIIEIESKVPDTLMGDSVRLKQVLINLLGNAIKFTEEGSVTLAISLQQLDSTDARLLFSVIDTGMGISAEQQDRLFQPFSQVDDGFSRNFEGTGLGLTISQNLVQLMGGSIKLVSNVGLGSCFSFELVLPIADLATIAPPLTPPINLNPEPLNGVRILVVEDDAFNQKIVNQVLKRFGASIVLANNGLEALVALEQEAFDIVLMDLHMPSMNGYEATLAIRKQARYAELPVITLSASVTDEEKRRCLATGMNDFIAKPINKVELLATLERWLKH